MDVSRQTVDPGGEMACSGVKTWILKGFDDPSLGPDAWNTLVHRGDTDVVFLTWHWLRAWWESLGRGRLLLIAAARDGEVVALAPFYADSGMVFFVGSGASDQMDFIGDTRDPAVLELLLQTARAEAPHFVGFRLYCVPETSQTAVRLKSAAGRLGLACYEEKRWPAPVIDLAADPDAVRASLRRVARHEQYFRRRGDLVLRQFCDGQAIGPHLEVFFKQHVSQWAMANDDSPILQRPPRLLGRMMSEMRRAFLERLTRIAADTGWLRLSRLDWNERPIAFEYGYVYDGTYFSGASSFAIDLIARSPGQVLLAQLLVASLDEGIETYDIGVGDEDPYGFLFATRLNQVTTWGLYPTDLFQNRSTPSLSVP